MEIKVEELLGKLDEQYKIHKSTTGEIYTLFEQQENILRESLEKYKPIYKWYKDKGFVFTHPKWKVKSVDGPVFGYVESDQEVITYNIDKQLTEKLNVYDTRERKNYPIYKLIRDGHFEDAMEGLLYLEKMLEKYIEKNHRSIEKLQSKINQV